MHDNTKCYADKDVYYFPKEAKNHARKSGPFVRDCMEVVFTDEELASSNLEGKHSKKQFDPVKSNLVKRKLLNSKLQTTLNYNPLNQLFNYTRSTNYYQIVLI